LIWSFAPDGRQSPPATLADIPPSTPDSAVLAKALKRHGFVFVGPTTVYATMQATGVVNDHLDGCVARGRGR
jgi:DNA-3-methyladenine glycosylase I